MPSASSLPSPRRDWALFLDVDGTLVEIAETPDGVVPDPRLPTILTMISTRLGGAVALISGRAIATLDSLFTPLRLPAAGLHGLERRGADGILHHGAPTTAIREAVEKAMIFSQTHPGVLVEDKGATVAVHFRQAPAAEPAVHALADGLARDLDGVVLLEGKMVVELRPAGSDKGTVIATFMAEPPFQGRMPVFIGDDVTDEAGFAAVNRLGGHSIRVGTGRATAACHEIADVPALLAWLEDWPGNR